MTGILPVTGSGLPSSDIGRKFGINGSSIDLTSQDEKANVENCPLNGNVGGQLPKIARKLLVEIKNDMPAVKVFI
jgi:hypothetical protein